MIQPFLSVGLPGFEPGKTEPKPVVLPLHHSPIIKCFLLKSGAKVVQSCELTKKNAKKMTFLCKKEVQEFEVQEFLPFGQSKIYSDC